MCASRFLLLFLLSCCGIEAISQANYDYVLAQKGQVLRASTDISATPNRHLWRDAARLALRAEVEDLRYANIEIAENQVAFFYNLLSQLYLQDETVQSLIDCYSVRTASSPSTNYMTLIYQRDIDWASPLRDGVTSTANPLINGMLERYDLIIEEHKVYNTRQDALVLRAINPINMSALANHFYTIKGIEAVGLGDQDMDKSNIFVKRVRDAWEVHYLFLFEEEEELHEHIWIYQVEDDGTVIFIDELGAALPNWLQCD